MDKTMKEKIIDFETAQLAKEKGFISQTNGWYNSLGGHNCRTDMDKEGNMIHNEKDYLQLFPAPTQTLLQKWLREKHHVSVTVKQNTVKVMSDTNCALFEADVINNEDKEYPRTLQSDDYEIAMEKGLAAALKLI